MEIKINSNALVSLSKLVKLEEVKSKILSYKLKDQTLSGDAVIYGKYYKKDNKKGISEILVEFEEIVPFTVVFNRDSVAIESVEVEEFKYELIEEGIKCSFIIEIEYDDEFQEVPIEPSYELEEKEEDIYEVLKEMNDEISEITDKLDEKLEEFFEDRNEESYIEADEEEYITEEQEIIDNELIIENNNNIITKKEGFIKNFKNEGKCIISIYYTNSPSDIEKISKQENIGIDKLYKDNENTGFNDRIIVKK